VVGPIRVARIHYDYENTSRTPRPQH
jgi:hypothetical protein